MKRLLDSIESGFSDYRDPLVRERNEALRLQQIGHETAIEQLGRRKFIHPVALDAARLSKFSEAIRERLRSADPSFRRQWLRLFVSEVPYRVRIKFA